jgi:glutamate 5-kinase
LREDVVQNIVTQLATLRQRGHDVLLVSSGAIALGLQALHQHHMPQTIAYQQAAAAIGQSHLIWTYEQLFTPLGQRVAQILLTHDDLRHRVRYLNARNTLQTLLHYGIIPIINENDTVSVAELRFGDNDTLSAMVCNLVNADLLIILTDIDGLYTADPRQDPAAELISTVHNIDADIEARAGNTTHTTGRGGMSSKIQAAKMAAANGLHTYIANGAYPDTLLRILAGDAVGTHIHAPTTSKLPSRKRWIGYALKPKGALTVDDGAKRALTAHGRSLLPSGIIDVTGNFGFGDAVYCVDTGARRFAQGLVNYSSADIQAIMGKHTSKIAHILGHKEYDEVIHRDNLALL